jgi:PemK-like, MazF-like toxin of type II toxin-antitoxin system
MPLPAHELGFVICYDFLWSHEADDRHDQGEKKRPAVIVLTTRSERGQTIVTVAPITHSEPRTGAHAIEPPAMVKQHLGLDSQASWIICNELNEFVWPGYPVPGGRRDQFDYRFIPTALYEQARNKILTLDSEAKRVMKRTG